MDQLAVHHDGSERYVRPVEPGQVGRLRLGDDVELRLRSAPDNSIERVLLRTNPDGEQVFTEMAEVPGEGDGTCRWWECRVALTEPVVGYRFAILTTDGLRWFNGTGLHEANPLDVADFRLVAGYEAPDWLDDLVIYQIFPDRFATSGRAPVEAHLRRVREFGLPASARDWDETPRHGREGLFEFYGGDLAGMEAKLDHLVSLGVNAIYMTPIFESLSNHGYDSIDYEHVAERFGGDAALASLRRATRDRGIRLILDIAPNHLGAGHPWFRAAQADATAPTAEYFSFIEHPHEYESWLGRKSLVKLDYRSDALREAMYAGPNGIMRRWLREPYAIDGWRVDVANMLGRLGETQLGGEVARGIRAAVREENPQAFLIGENWFDATEQLTGDQYDAAMNYAGFTTPLLAWLAGVELESAFPIAPARAPRISTAAFAETLANFRAAVPWAIARQQMLLLGSHDTGRIKTVLGGEPSLLRLAFGMLMTYPGVPCVFYGDEIGLEGEGSLETRRTMPWNAEAWDREFLGFVRSLVSLRRSLPALARGGLQMLEVSGNSIVYLRETNRDVAIVLANRGPASRPAGLLDVSGAALRPGLELRDMIGGGTAIVANCAVGLPELPPGISIWYGSR